MIRSDNKHTNVKDRAEATASKLCKLVDSKHLNVRVRTSLASKPLLKLDHLDILKSDSSINAALDDGFGDVHATSNGSVFFWSHTIMSGKLVDLNLTELTDVANALALQGGEIGGYAAVLEVDNSSERLIKKRTNGGNWEITGFGLDVLVSIWPLDTWGAYLQQECESWP